MRYYKQITTVVWGKDCEEELSNFVKADSYTNLLVCATFW